MFWKLHQIRTCHTIVVVANFKLPAGLVIEIRCLALPISIEASSESSLAQIGLGSSQPKGQTGRPRFDIC